MQVGPAIFLTLGIIVVSMFVSPIFLWLAIFGTAIWAAVDSSKIELHKYKSGIAYKPFVLFIGCVGLWVIGFPWYLVMRHRIKNALAELKEHYKQSKEH